MRFRSNDIRFRLKFHTNDASFKFKVHDMENGFKFHYDDFFEVDKSYNAYLGEYEVVPAIKKQQLDTKDKLMKKDVVISAIPFFETSNDEGGNTVYIGKEL